MQNMKRIISIFLLLTVFFSQSVFAEDILTENAVAETVSEHIEILEELGIIEKDVFSAEKVVTREELAYIGGRMLGFDDSGILLDKTIDFVDIDKSPYQLYIQALNQIGIMVGVNQYQFKPELPASYLAAVKVLTAALGYGVVAEDKGGWPSGYLSTAASLDILPANVKNEESITWAELAEMVVLSFDAPLMKIETIGSGIKYKKDADNFLSCFYDIYEVRGQVTDNGITALNGASKVAKHQIKVNNVIMDKGSTDLEGKIGAELICWYRAENQINTALYYEITDNTDAISIVAADVVNTTKTSIEYAYKNKTKTINISEYADVIYNGEYYQDYNAGTFNIKNGKLTVFETKSNYTGYDLVIIEEFEAVWVARADAVTNTIYGRYGEAIRLDDFESCRLYDADGKTVLLSAVTEDMVASVYRGKGGASAKIYFSNATVEGVLKQIKNNGTQNIYIINDTEYKLSSALQTALTKGVVGVTRPVLGKDYTAYLDMENNIAAITGATPNAYYAYLTKVSRGVGFDADYGFARLCLSTGEFATVKTAEKITINQASTAVDGYTIISIPELYDEHSQLKPQLVKVKLNSRGELTEIETAGTELNAYGYNAQRFTKVYEKTNAYWRSSNKVMGEHSILPDAPIFMVPEDLSEDKFSVINVSNISGSGSLYFDVIMYDFDATLCAQAMVIKTKDTAPNYQGCMFVVDSAQKVLNENGDGVWRMQGYWKGLYCEFTEDKEGIIDAIAPNGIKRGDVLRISQKPGGIVVDRKLVAAEFIASLRDKTEPEVNYYEGAEKTSSYIYHGPIYATSKSGISIITDYNTKNLSVVNPLTSTTYLLYDVQQDTIEKINYEDIISLSTVLEDGEISSLDTSHMLFTQMNSSYMQLAVLVKLN